MELDRDGESKGSKSETKKGCAQGEAIWSACLKETLFPPWHSLNNVDQIQER